MSEGYEKLWKRNMQGEYMKAEHGALGVGGSDSTWVLEGTGAFESQKSRSET